MRVKVPRLAGLLHWLSFSYAAETPDGQLGLYNFPLAKYTETTVTGELVEILHRELKTGVQPASPVGENIASFFITASSAHELEVVQGAVYSLQGVSSSVVQFCDAPSELIVDPEVGLLLF